MTPFFGSVFWLLVTLGVLVTFHEFGHYWVARRCGVKVLRFSVGFGRAIWQRIGRDGTEYQIAAIPLGGYVKMLDAREGDVDPALLSQEFTSQPLWKRIAIVAAGPGFNLIFTLCAFWLMFMLGRPDIAPVVAPTAHSLAADAGIRAGDRVLSVDGQAVTTWGDSLDAIATAMLSRAPTSVIVRGTDNAERTVTLPLDQLPPGESVDQYMDKLGLKPAPAPAIAATVMPGQPAALAGMQGGDKLISVNGQNVSNIEDFVAKVSAAAAKSPALQLVVARNGNLMPFNVTARLESLDGQPARWMIGIGQPPPEQVIQHYGPLQAASEAVKLSWQYTRQTFTMIGQMVSGHASTKNLSGVIGIAQVANAAAQMGLATFLFFLGVVSLSLAILNLLPIPVLDGGHLLYYLIELVKGSPVSERTMIAGQYVGLALLFTLMGLAFYNDIHRIILPS